MANIVETSVWEDGIYQLEKTDKAMGGADGVLNKPLKQLANRTKYLKEKADEIEEELAGFGEVSPETIAAVGAIAAHALVKAKYEKDARELRDGILTQRGRVMIKNRGVVSGCVVSKSTSAARNLSVASGVIFYGSRLIPVAGQENVAVVPSNTGDESVVCWCYLQKDSSGAFVLKCTQPGQDAPEDSMTLYKVTIPAGNTAESDSSLSSVTLTDVRRVESGWPKYMVSASYAQIAFETAFADDDYEVQLDTVGYEGSGFQQGMIYVGERASNGFKIYTNGTVDSMDIRWKVTRRSL